MISDSDRRLAFLLAGGEVGALIEARAWDTHPLGCPDDWSAALRTSLQIMLASPLPTILFWDARHFVFYNDAARALVGAAHPAALGRPAAEGLAKLWHALGSAVGRGEAARLSAQLQPDAEGMEHDILISPVGDDLGRSGGMLCTVLDPVARLVDRQSDEGGSDADELQRFQHKLLELTLQERPLQLILEEVVSAAQTVLGPQTVCSILLTNDNDDKLHHGASVGLSADYIKVIDGLPIGPVAGSCGTAAYRAAPVMVADIDTDPLWQECRDLPLSLGLRACWSSPVLGARSKVLGAFAIYNTQPGLPSVRQREFLDLVSRVSALILERYAAQEALNDQKRVLETLNRTGAGVAAELDHEALVQMVTDAGVELTGAQFGAFFYNIVDKVNESYMLYTLSGVDSAAFSDFPMPRNTQVFEPTFAGVGIVRSDDITRDPRYAKNAPYRGMPKGHLPVRSYLAVPVISRTGEVLGALFFGHEEPGRFSAHHEKLMDGLAGQASIAVDNARLYRSAQREIEVRRRAENDLIRIKGDLELAQERMELALDAGAIIGTWIWHVPEDCITADERFGRAFGLNPEQCRTGIPLTEATASVHPDDRERVHALIEASVRAGGVYRAEYRACHADGNYRWVEASGVCELDEAGQAVRFPGVLLDIEQRRRIEADLERREADLALLLDSTADGFYAVGTDGRATRCNAAFLRMLGFEREDQVVGKQLHDTIHHTHADGTPYKREDCPIYRVASIGGMAHVDNEIFYRTDGSSFPVEYWVRPVYWQGELQGAVCNILDISERKRGEEARQLLMRELNHRVKNLFSITAGMITMTARHANSVAELAETLSGRVLALARAHELISSSITSGEGDVMPSGLDKLIEVVMAPHVEGRPAALDIAGPPLELGPTATTSFALILHELATNAAKYGALSAAGGRVRVVWTQEDEMMHLEWSETGGPEVTGPPKQSGFGSKLARLSATGQLDGSIDYVWDPTGVTIRLTASIERLAQ
ncbi:MAG: GAF domain-containing protein [Celeribacter sp.]